MKCLKDQETQFEKKLVKKYGKNVPVEGIAYHRSATNSEKYLDGEFTIKSIRKYKTFYRTLYDVDLCFKGKINCRYNATKGWRGSEIQSERNISKIKINKFIRRYICRDVSNFLLTFGIQANPFTNLAIKKVTWE